MKGKILQIILVNSIVIIGFFAYLYYLLTIPPCEDKMLLIMKTTPLIILIIGTIIYNVIMQKKVNADVSDQIQREVKNELNI